MVIPLVGGKVWARCQNATAGSLFLVGQDFAVGQPRMIVDRVVQVAVADMAVAVAVEGLTGCAGAVTSSGLAAGDAVSATVGDVAQLLDADMHQLTRGGALIAPHRHCSNPVEMGQAGQT